MHLISAFRYGNMSAVKQRRKLMDIDVPANIQEAARLAAEVIAKIIIKAPVRLAS